MYKFGFKGQFGITIYEWTAKIPVSIKNWKHSSKFRILRSYIFRNFNLHSMKKLIPLPFLVVVALVCFALPGKANTPSDTKSSIILSIIPQSVLDDIFVQGVPLLEQEYGITTSVSELHIGYNDGTVSVIEVDKDTYKISLGGDTTLVVFEDAL